MPLILVALRSVGDPIIVQRHIRWSSKPITLEQQGKQVKAANFYGANYDKAHGTLPYYYECIKVNDKGDVTAKITNAVYAPVTDESLVQQGRELIKSEIVANAHERFIRAKPYACVNFLPFRINSATGRIEQLVSFGIELTVTPSTNQKNITTRSGSNVINWAANSVLATGSWYEFGVNTDGIYKLDKSFFQSLGINIANINPQTIRVYGNGGGMLPEDNSVSQYNDLMENAIYFSGGTNTTFGDNDYFLVYGQSPNRWSYNTQSKIFNHQVHLYSNYTYYFITTNYNPGTPAKRVPTQYYSGTANKTVTSFNDYQFHETDQENLIQSGRIWFGETFQNQQLSYSPPPFSFPNVITSSPGTLISSVGARSIGSAYSSFTISVNGATLTQNVSGVSGNFEAAYAAQITSSIPFTPSSSVSVNVNYIQATSADVGWLYYIELNVRRALTMAGDQMEFRDAASVGAGNIDQFNIAGAQSNLTVWDVTDPLNVVRDSALLSNGTLQFKVPVDTTLHQFMAFDGQTFLNPAVQGTIVGAVANQNLHGLSATDMVIITAPQFAAEATELANYHQQHDNISAMVVNENQVFNEFSSGAPDIVGIRNFMRMFFDRAGTDTTKMPKYLLLFGDGSYDYKNRIPNNTNYILTYQSAISLDPLNTYTSDDFFGFLDDADGADFVDNDYKLDIAIGRIPADNTQQASQEISKIMQYSTPQDFGSWRNTITYLSDASVNAPDFENASETITNDIVTPNYPVYNINKIYLDAFPVATAPGGQSYPGANTALYNQIYTGTLMVDYNGHGSAVQLSAANVLTISDINSWTNSTMLPLFVTATCQFTEFDNPAQQSAGELMLLKPNGGAIALVSTVRFCEIGGNTTLNEYFNSYIFQPVDGQMPRLGDAYLNAKNATGPEYGNTCKFLIFGDPALRLAYPQFNVQTTAINNKAITSKADTLKALGKVTISGIVTDNNGNKLTNFNGIIYPTIYDKPITYSTLGSNGVSIIPFQMQNSIIYKGEASVHNGSFSFTFVVPKDIAYQYGFGKISYYADDAQNDANGYFSHVIVGGLADTFALDKSGPTMKLYMNNTQFVFGGITDANPKLLVLLADSFGINVTSNGIGHNITAVMDNNTQNTTDLNSFYQADLDNYQKGTVLYPYTNLADGLHSINVTAWNVYDKSSEGYIEFIVASSAQMALDHVLNYPNPFTTHTTFMFDDNAPGQLLHVQIQIYTVSGKLVKTITTDESSDGYHVGNINWNGLDDYGDPIGRGVYIYRIYVTNSSGLSANQYQKLVVLR